MLKKKVLIKCTDLKSHFFDFGEKSEKIEKMGFQKKKSFFGRKFHEKPQIRVFIEKNSYTACFDRNYPKFAFIKKIFFFRHQNLGKKMHVFHGKMPFFSLFFSSDMEHIANSSPSPQLNSSHRKQKIRKNLKFFQNLLKSLQTFRISHRTISDDKNSSLCLNSKILNF